jgi:hypothetical protein
MRIKYTEELLYNCIYRDNAVIIGNYDNITRNSIIKFKCKCNIDAQKNLRCIYNYGAFCKKCTTSYKIKKIKETCINKYGVDNPLKSDQIKDKVKDTNIKKYGVEYGVQCDNVKQKIINTCLKKYGVKHTIEAIEVKQKIKNTIYNKYGVDHYSKTDEYKDKFKNTIINRYGVDHYSKTDEYKNKCKNTCIKEYGVEHYSKTEEYKERCKNTAIKHYNVEYPSQTDEIKNKYKQTCLKRYGVENPAQSQEIQEKTQKNAKKYKDYIMPNGEIRKVQGYEPFALNELVKFYKDDDILTNRKDIPRIQYIINDKKKYYFPDIYIKSINKIIEVKSTWTYNCKEDFVKEKEEATKKLGYDYEIWIYDGKGGKIIK